MNIAFVGCSYTHWEDGDCKNKNYPALFAKAYPEHNIYDLSIPGASNDSIYFRLYYAQKHYGVRFDKIVVQMTHFARTLHWYNKWEYEWDEPLGQDSYSKKNYTSIGSRYSFKNFNTITSGVVFFENIWQSKVAKKIEKSIGIKFSQLQKYFAHEFDGHKYVWQCQKELDTVNGVYGKENVIIFSWHENFDSKTSKHHDIILPDNYIGSVDKTFGKKFKEDYAADSSPHFNAAGHLAIYKWLSPHIKSYMEEIG